MLLVIVKTGGKQYVAQEGDKLVVEKLEGEEGTTITLKEILLVADGDAVKVGRPIVENASVELEIEKQGKAKKVEILKFKRKVGYRRKKGHRQEQTTVRVKKIKI